MKQFSICLGLCVLFGSSFLFAAEPTWPVFHGPKGDNICPETNLLKSWPEEGPKLLWRAEKLGDAKLPGYAGITIGNGMIYTSGNVDQGENKANSFVFALDAKTGKEVWHYDNGDSWTGHYPGERVTPTLDGNRVYAYSSKGRIACLDAKTGKEIWAKQAAQEADADLPTWAYAESIVVDGNQVACWPGGKKVAVFALDKMTGQTIWETPGTGAKGNYSTMLVFEHAGRKVYANMNQNGLLIVDAKTGKSLLSYEHPTKHDIKATIPYYLDGTIVITSGYGTTGTERLKLTANDDQWEAERMWQQKNLDNQHGGIIVLDNVIYGASHTYKGGSWTCIDLNTGDEKWNAKGVGNGSVLYADGMLYCFGEKEGDVALVKATPEKYEEVCRFKLPEEGDGAYWAHPVICDGKLYLRHAGFLYCYDVKN